MVKYCNLSHWHAPGDLNWGTRINFRLINLRAIFLNVGKACKFFGGRRLRTDQGDLLIFRVFEDLDAGSGLQKLNFSRIADTILNKDSVFVEQYIKKYSGKGWKQRYVS